LELGYINVECTIEAKGSSERRDNLSNEAVEVGVGGALNVEGATADVVDCLVVEHDCNIGVLKERMGGENAVVWLNYSSGNLGRWVYAETELGFASVVNGEALKKKGSKTRSSATANSVEAEESLETSAVVSKLANAVKYEVNNLLANGVVSTSVVVCCVFLSGDDLFRVVELAVGSGANFVTHGGLEVNEDCTGYMLASSSLGEEGVECIITSTDGLVRGHLSVGLDAMLEAVEFPAGITYLNTSLANVNADNLTHLVEKRRKKNAEKSR